MLLAITVLFLLLSAVAWPSVSARLSARQSGQALVGITGGALALALLLRFQPGPHSLTLVVWEPQTVFGGSLVLLADRVAAVWTILVTAIALASALALVDRHTADQRRLVLSGLILTVATIIFILAGNLVTLAVTWLLLDVAVWLALYWSTRPQPLALRVLTVAVNYAGSLLVFLAAVAAYESGPTVAGLPWQPGMLSGLGPSLLTLAALIRLGAYPLQRNLPDAADPALRAWLRGLPLAAGAYLLVRAVSLTPTAPVSGLGWTLLAGAAALGAGLLAAVAASREETQRALAAYAASMLLLGLSVRPVEAASLTLYGAVGLVLALGALILGERLPSAAGGRQAWWWGQALRWVALLNLWGLPPTLGFYHRWGTLRADLALTDTAALMFGVLAATFASSALWSLTRPPGASPDPSPLWPTLAGLSVLGAPLLAFGLQPTLIQPALEAVAGALAPEYVADLLRGTAMPAGLVVGLLILGPWLVGRLIQRRLALAPGDVRPLRALRYWVGLDWLFARRWRPVGFAYRSLQAMLALGEDERYVGLLIVLAIVTAIALLAQL